MSSQCSHCRAGVQPHSGAVVLGTHCPRTPKMRKCPGNVTTFARAIKPGARVLLLWLLSPTVCAPIHAWTTHIATYTQAPVSATGCPTRYLPAQWMSLLVIWVTCARLPGQSSQLIVPHCQHPASTCPRRPDCVLGTFCFSTPPCVCACLSSPVCMRAFARATYQCAERARAI